MSNKMFIYFFFIILSFLLCYKKHFKRDQVLLKDYGDVDSRVSFTLPDEYKPELYVERL